MPPRRKFKQKQRNRKKKKIADFVKQKQYEDREARRNEKAWNAVLGIGCLGVVILAIAIPAWLFVSFCINYR